MGDVQRVDDHGEPQKADDHVDDAVVNVAADDFKRSVGPLVVRLRLKRAVPFDALELNRRTRGFLQLLQQDMRLAYVIHAGAFARTLPCGRTRARHGGGGGEGKGGARRGLRAEALDDGLERGLVGAGALRGDAGDDLLFKCRRTGGQTGRGRERIREGAVDLG